MYNEAEKQSPSGIVWKFSRASTAFHIFFYILRAKENKVNLFE